MLSMADRKVMIKSILQAIPMYLHDYISLSSNFGQWNSKDREFILVGFESSSNKRDELAGLGHIVCFKGGWWFGFSQHLHFWLGCVRKIRMEIYFDSNPNAFLSGVSSNLNKYFPMLWIMGAYIKMPGEWNIICIMPMFLQAYFGGSVESVSLIQRVMKPCSTESNVEEEAHECWIMHTAGIQQKWS